MFEVVDKMNRYDRLLQLSTFSKEKLNILLSKKVLLIGVGGVGQSVATSLITNGILDLTIVDFDRVEISNLNRQILLKEDDEGLSKIEVVQKELEERNKDAHIKALLKRINSENATNISKGYDVIIDAVDNWETKLVIAQAAKENQTPLLHIGVDGNRGQFCLFCEKSLSDIFSNEIKTEPRDGVLGSMVHSVAELATTYLINHLVGNKDISDILYYFDFEKDQFGKVLLK